MNSNGDSPQRVPEISTPDGAGLEWDEVAAANTTDGGHSESGPKSSVSCFDSLASSICGQVAFKLFFLPHPRSMLSSCVVIYTNKVRKGH